MTCESDVTERTLYHLSMCDDLASKIVDGDERAAIPGPKDSSWADLLVALMEGFERGWVHEANLTRVDGHTKLLWTSTPSGGRAFAAFRRRGLARSTAEAEPAPNRLLRPIALGVLMAGCFYLGSAL